MQLTAHTLLKGHEQRQSAMPDREAFPLMEVWGFNLRPRAWLCYRHHLSLIAYR